MKFDRQRIKVRPLSSIMDLRGHTHLSLLKVDIEGVVSLCLFISFTPSFFSFSLIRLFKALSFPS
jgi:hypothetical protein